MKKLILLILPALALGCGETNEPQVSDFSSLELTEEKSTVSVTLFDAHGAEVTSYSQMEPNSEYKLKFASDTEIGIQMKFTDGFDVISADVPNDVLSTERVMKIKTWENESPRVYGRFIPIRMVDERLMKEYQQNFLIAYEN